MFALAFSFATLLFILASAHLVSLCNSSFHSSINLAESLSFMAVLALVESSTLSEFLICFIFLPSMYLLQVLYTYFFYVFVVFMSRYNEGFMRFRTVLIFFNITHEQTSLPQIFSCGKWIR